jgi:hypothetical protein
MCLAEKLYRSAVGRELADAETPFVDYLGTVFGEQGYRVPLLMRAIALSKTFYAATAPPITKPAAQTSAAPRKGARS